jgi:integrase
MMHGQAESAAECSRGRSGRALVRRLLREVELRQDIRAGAIFSLLLFTGCRVGDLVNLEIPDLTLGERSGTVVFRFGKGNKQRSVPLPLPARQTPSCRRNDRA